MRSRGGRIDTRFLAPPAAVPVPLDPATVRCEAGNSERQSLALSDEACLSLSASPGASRASLSYIESLYMPALFASGVAALVTVITYILLVSLMCCGGCRCWRCLGARVDIDAYPALKDAIGDDAAPAEETQEEQAARRLERFAASRFAHETVPIGCGTRAASWCYCFLLFAIAGVAIGMMTAPCSHAADSASQVASAAGAVGSWLDGVSSTASRVGVMARGAAAGPLATAAARLRTSGQLSAASAVDSASAALREAGQSVEGASASLGLSDAAAALSGSGDDVTSSLRLAAIGVAATSAVFAAVMLVTGTLAVCTARHWCVPCCFWSCQTLLYLLVWPLALAAFLALWTSAALTADVCAFPGSTVASVVGAAVSSTGAVAWSAASSPPASFPANESAVTTAAFYLAPQEALEALGMPPGAFTSCAAAVDAGTAPAPLSGAPPASLPALVLRGAASADGAADALSDVNRSSAGAAESLAEGIAAARSIAAALNRTAEDDLGCDRVRSAFAGLVRPVCAEYVESALIPAAFASLSILSAWLVAACCGLGPCCMHPSRAWVPWADVIGAPSPPGKRTTPGARLRPGAARLSRRGLSRRVAAPAEEEDDDGPEEADGDDAASQGGSIASAGSEEGADRVEPGAAEGGWAHEEHPPAAPPPPPAAAPLAPVAPALPPPGPALPLSPERVRLDLMASSSGLSHAGGAPPARPGPASPGSTHDHGAPWGHHSRAAMSVGGLGASSAGDPAAEFHPDGISTSSGAIKAARSMSAGRYGRRGVHARSSTTAAVPAAARASAPAVPFEQAEPWQSPGTGSQGGSFFGGQL